MTSINDFAKAVSDAMERYGSNAAEAAKTAVDKVAAGAEQEVKKHITFKQRTRKYVRAFRMTTSHEGMWDRRKTWHVRSPHYRLTHLLENGHLSRDGTTRVKAYPHIVFGEQYVEENLERTVAEYVKKAGL